MNDDASPPAQPNRIKLLAARYWARRKLTLPLTVLGLLVLALAVPLTRYPLLGLFLKSDFQVQVLDDTTHKPVTKATVNLGGHIRQTDEKGQAKLRTKVGPQHLTVTKKYFRTSEASQLVPLRQKNAPFRVMVRATGRQVPIVVKNRLTGAPLAGAVLAAAGAEVKTDKAGKATIVLPADNKTISARLTANGYNTVTSAIQVTDAAVPANTFVLAPAGHVYFLSKLTGKIDVVKTNLDGSGRQTVLAGAGTESPTDTVLLASRDWKYLVLKSKRDGGENSKLFLIDTATDKLTTIDEGSADFTTVGWADHSFVYTVSRKGYQNWQPGAVSLKSYDAASARINNLDTTKATGTSDADAKYEVLFTDRIQLVGNTVLYAKIWYAYPGYINVPGQQNTLTAVNASGAQRKTVASWNGDQAYADLLFKYGPNEVIARIIHNSGAPEDYYSYKSDGSYTQTTDKADIDALNRRLSGGEYPTHLVSPSGARTFWTEARDGKNALFVGDDDGHDGKQVSGLGDYTAYGWFTDNYLLVSKNASELYIVSADGGAPLKIADYHKPDSRFLGYGGGYGGL